MIFTDIRVEIMDRLGYTSTTAQTRVGRAINRLYREVGTSIGLSFTRQTAASEVVTIGNANVTFSESEKVLQVWRLDGSSNPVVLDEVLLAEMRDSIIPTSDKPTAWALFSTTSNGVTIRINASPETAYTIYADVIAEVSDLSGSNEPAFPESFHDILIEGVLKDEYRKLEKVALARDSEATFQRRLSDLRMFVAKSNYLDIQQGKHAEGTQSRAVSGGTSAAAVTGPSTPSSTDNAIVRWDGTGGRIIQDSGITVGDGASGTLSGTNTGDQTITLTGDVTGSGTGSFAATIAADAVTDAKLRESGALSVIGRSANTTGNPADISASAASDAVLRESGSVLGFGTVATAGIANNAITDTKIRDSAALSVIGRSANSSGDPADIAAASDNQFLARSSDALAFQAIDHGANVSGLTDDDHTQYALLAGRATGQVITGGTASGDDLTLRSTSNATKGDVLIADEGGNVIIGGGTAASELRLLEASGSGTNYTAFKAQAQAGDITYTLPADDGDADQVLSTDGSGTLDWVTPASSSPTIQTTTSTGTKNDFSTSLSSSVHHVILRCNNASLLTITDDD